MTFADAAVEVEVPGRKRVRDEPGMPASPLASIPRCVRVRFSHVDVRIHCTELWGGGGVPSDEGPPLGLSWDVEGERRVRLEDFELERHHVRTPKDTYCTVGCVAPHQRTEMLLVSGTSPRQIKAVKRAVAQVNLNRWKTSAVLFNDAWLFSAAAHTEPSDVIAMLGCDKGCEPVELNVADWNTPSDLADALSVHLGDDLMYEGRLDWAKLADALQGVGLQLAFVVDCTAATHFGLLLLGRLVGCIHTAHVAAHVATSRRGDLSVVLLGYDSACIGADWSDDEPDEFDVTLLE